MKVAMPVVVAIVAIFLAWSKPKLLPLLFPPSKAAALFSAKEAFRASLARHWSYLHDRGRTLPVRYWRLPEHP